jgi:hypothetical protein
MTPLASRLEPALLKAYLQTHYRVCFPDAFTLQIGTYSVELAHWHARLGVRQSGFVTACNPGSRRLLALENEKRQAQLIDAVVKAGYPFHEGFSEHPENGWPKEASLLVFGAHEQDLVRLCATFGQNAFVVANEEAVPRLCCLI